MKRVIILIIAFAACAGMYIAGRENPTELTAAVQSGEIIRLHVVAASDDEYDQETKLYVRDAVIELCGARVGKGKGVDEIAAVIEDMLPEIEMTAKTAALANGYDGPVKATFGICDFPERVYAGELVPAGRYKALRVVLGDGNGANWWCVMYPPLCFIGEEAVQPGEYVEVKFESVIARWFKKR